MAKVRQKRSDKELRRASLIVQYEVISLYTCHDMLQSSCVGWSSGDREKVQSNAYLHAMLLAARNLLAFLFAHKPRPSDIIAEDFFDDPAEWQKHRVVPAPEMANGDLIDRISKRLAHLTWERAGTDKPLWGGFRIAWFIALALESFVKLAEKSRVHEQLREDVALVIVNLKAVLNQHPELASLMAPATDSLHFDDLTYFGDECPEADPESE